MKDMLRAHFSVKEQSSADLFTVTPALVATLHMPYQLAVHLHCIERWSYATIAKRLQLPEGTVKSHISRGVRRLRERALFHSVSMVEKEQAEELLIPLAFTEMLVDTLPEPYRMAVYLHYIQGQSYSMIALQLMLPEGTVKSHIHRGMRLLRSQLS